MAVGPTEPICRHLRSGAPIQSLAKTHDFAPISTDEMAFALTLFVETANRRILSPETGTDQSSQDRAEVCRHLYRTLCADIDEFLVQSPSKSEHQTTLYAAFSTLCSYYDGDPLQAAVCARVLAFHFLMERTAGAALADWVQAHPERAELVILAPAVLEAIATFKLHGSILVPERAFLELVTEKHATSLHDRLQ